MILKRIICCRGHQQLIDSFNNKNILKGMLRGCDLRRTFWVFFYCHSTTQYWKMDLYYKKLSSNINKILHAWCCQYVSIFSRLSMSIYLHLNWFNNMLWYLTLLIKSLTVTSRFNKLQNSNIKRRIISICLPHSNS